MQARKNSHHDVVRENVIVGAERKNQQHPDRSSLDGSYESKACNIVTWAWRNQTEFSVGTDPNHYLLPADLSRHTKSTDPLKGGRGFDPTRHQTSWRTSWRSLRKAAGDRILDRVKKENRDLTMEEQDALKVFQNVRFHDLRQYADSPIMPNLVVLPSSPFGATFCTLLTN